MSTLSHRAVLRDFVAEYELIAWTAYDRVVEARAGEANTEVVEFTERSEVAAFFRRTESAFRAAELRRLIEELRPEATQRGSVALEDAIVDAIYRGELLVVRRVLMAMTSEVPELFESPIVHEEPERLVEDPDLPRVEAVIEPRPKLSARAGIKPKPPTRATAKIGVRPKQVRAKIVPQDKRVEVKLEREPKRVEVKLEPVPKRVEGKVEVPPRPKLQPEPEPTQKLQPEPKLAPVPVVAPSHYFEAYLIDDHHRPIVGEPYRVELADGSVQEGETDELGRVRLDGVEPGSATLGFPRLDGSSWEPGSAPPYLERSPTPQTKPKHEGEPSSYFEAYLLDEHERAVEGEPYALELPDGSVREGKTNEHGGVRIEGVDPGTCKLSFPRLDGDSWEAQ